MRSNACNSSAGQFRMKREHKSCSRSAGGMADPGAAWPAAFCACQMSRSAPYTPAASLHRSSRALGAMALSQRRVYPHASHAAAEGSAILRVLVRVAWPLSKSGRGAASEGRGEEGHVPAPLSERRTAKRDGGRERS
jgi:hypothetical protein